VRCCRRCPTSTEEVPQEKRKSTICIYIELEPRERFLSGVGKRRNAQP
jgi:hypothetical protein